MQTLIKFLGFLKKATNMRVYHYHISITIHSIII